VTTPAAPSFLYWSKNPSLWSILHRTPTGNIWGSPSRDAKDSRRFWGVMLCYWVMFWWITVLSTQWKLLINHTVSQFTSY